MWFLIGLVDWACANHLTTFLQTTPKRTTFDRCSFLKTRRFAAEWRSQSSLSQGFSSVATCSHLLLPRRPSQLRHSSWSRNDSKIGALFHRIDLSDSEHSRIFSYISLPYVQLPIHHWIWWKKTHSGATQVSASAMNTVEVLLALFEIMKTDLNYNC